MAQQFAPPPPPAPQVKTVKVKLKVGSPVEVFSKSKQQWIAGEIVKIKGKLICVSYGANAETQKWLEATSKEFRPPMNNTANSNEQKQDVADRDAMNNPTANRVRKSIAFQQKKPVKIRLGVGSPVEVFSVSKNQWIDGKLTGIKRNLIRVAYGDGLTVQKWLKANSDQFRPKLDMVDAAMDAKIKSPSDQFDPSALGDCYAIAEEEEHDTHYIPLNDAHKYNNADHDQLPAAEYGSGAYVTQSLRREQYLAPAAESVKGINRKRGDLKVKVHGALQLRSNGNFAKIQIAEHTLKTKKVASDENPVWKEIVTFSNFRPQLGKTGVISVCNKSAIMGEKVIGSAEFELPIVFGRQEKMTIDIADSKNKLSGIVVIESIVVDSK